MHRSKDNLRKIMKVNFNIDWDTGTSISFLGKPPFVWGRDLLLVNAPERFLQFFFATSKNRVTGLSHRQTESTPIIIPRKQLATREERL